jgi:DNA-binding SARP family transcriptional activator/Tfp pilus assembly protein PilF
MAALKLLGGAHLVGADGACAGQACQRHRIALLALLRAAPHATLPRERLMALLWPEHPDHRARRLLNLSVHVLRRALRGAESAVVSSGHDLRMRTELIDSDVAAFEAAAAAGNYAQAVALYTGPFLDGFFLPESHEFEEWQASERARLSRLHAAALEALAREAENGADPVAAVQWWTQLADQDPLDSRVVVRLMTALEAAGSRQEALRRAAAHTTLLRTELDADPPPDLSALIERMRHHPRAVAKPAVVLLPTARAPAGWGLSILRLTGVLVVVLAGSVLLRPMASSAPHGAVIAEPPPIRPAPAPSRRSEAHQLYLRGRYEWNQRTERNLWNAVATFRAAIAADPTYAAAYAGLADAYRLLPAYANVDGPAALRQSLAAAHRAVELDNRSADAHTALGASLQESANDRARAAREYRTAIALDPRHVTALRWYGLHLAGDGAFDSALVYAQRARQLDPLSPVTIGAVGTVYYFARRPKHAIRAFQDALALNPDWPTGLAVLGRVYMMAGQPELALAPLERAVQLSKSSLESQALLARAYALVGREREARQLADRLAPGTGSGYVPAVALASVYLALAEPDSALRWLRRGVELQDTDLKYLKVDPRFDGLSDEAEFQRILGELQLR